MFHGATFVDVGNIWFADRHSAPSPAAVFHFDSFYRQLGFDAELRAYDKFWDSVSVERTLLDDRYQKGMEKGMEKGRAEGKHEANTETAQRLLAMGLSAEQVAKATQLPLEIIKNLNNT